MMDRINEDLQKLDQYFKSIVNTVPSGVYIMKTNDTEDFAGGMSMSDRKTVAKRRKLDPQNMKIQSGAIAQDNVKNDEDEIPQQKIETGMMKHSNTSITELQIRLQEKLHNMKTKGNSKNKISKKNPKKKDKKLKSSKKMQLKTFIQQQPVQKKIEDVSDVNSGHITTKEGKIVYSKFDFGQLIGAFEKKKKKKETLPVGKNYKLLLQKAERKEELMNQMRLEDPAKAEKLMERNSWEKAEAKAEGLKLKDDPTLLKMSLKRKESKKKQSAKKWKEREEQVAHMMKSKQEKRSRNIQRRKTLKKDKKLRKRGVVPGF